MIFIDYYYENDDIKWKKIYWKNGDKTKYSISNIGIIRNDLNGRLLKTNYSKGYERISLTHNGKSKQFFVHRLVAIAFIPNPENKSEVNHINGDKSCNYDFNLEWVTPSENVNHSYNTGLNKHINRYHKINKETIEKICKLLEDNELNISQIANITGVSRQVVGRINKKETYQAISSNYNIDNYKIKHNFSKNGDDNDNTKYSDKDIKEVCELLDRGFRPPDVAYITGIPYQTVRNVFYGTCRKSISKKYNFMKIRLVNNV